MIVKILDKKVLMPELKVFKADKNSDSITFETDKVYNGIDLSQYTVYLKYLRVDGFSDKIYLTTTVDGDKIRFTWTISLAETSYSGELKLQLCFDNDDDFTLNTEIFTIEIGESLSGYEGIDNGFVDVTAQFAQYVTRTEFNEAISSKVDMTYFTSNVNNMLSLKQGKLTGFVLTTTGSRSITLSPNNIFNYTSKLNENETLSISFSPSSWSIGGYAIFYAWFDGGSMVIDQQSLPIKFFGEDCEAGEFYPSLDTKYEFNCLYTGEYVSIAVAKML